MNLRQGPAIAVSLRTPMRSILAILALGIVGSCEAGSILLPATAKSFEPPPVYSTWWQLVRECSQGTALLESVQWFTVPGQVVTLHDRRAGAFWIADGNRIVVAEDHLLRGDLIRHEMLHAQLGVAGHPRTFFLGNCAGVVSCAENCVEGDMTIPADVVGLPADSLALHVAVVPGSPSASQDDGHFVARVTATNPLPFPVVIEWSPGDPVTRGFGFDVRGPNGGYAESLPVADPSSILFAPGETKSYLFDFFIGSTTTPYVGVGDHVLVGSFSATRSEALEVRIAP